MEGNQQKMREALERFMGWYNITSIRTASLRTIAEAARAALAAPPRQCDVGTAEEQERARSRETVAAIEKHYNRAKEWHPYFCDRLHPAWAECNIKEITRRALDDRRARLKAGARDGNLVWDEILDCEVWEVADAMANGDTAAAVEECYDCIAVLLRTIDVLEGRQKLGREGSEQ